MTPVAIEALCREWQAILRLADWDVRCKLVRHHEMSSNEWSGECRYRLTKKMALIQLLDPVDFPDGEWPEDVEKTLVHELLHLHMAPFAPEDGTLENVAMEQAIESIASALVRVRRESRAEAGEETPHDRREREGPQS